MDFSIDFFFCIGNKYNLCPGTIFTVQNVNIQTKSQRILHMRRACISFIAGLSRLWKLFHISNYIGVGSKYKV